MEGGARAGVLSLIFVKPYKLSCFYEIINWKYLSIICELKSLKENFMSLKNRVGKGRDQMVPSSESLQHSNKQYPGTPWAKVLCFFFYTHCMLFLSLFYVGLKTKAMFLQQHELMEVADDCFKS